MPRSRSRRGSRRPSSRAANVARLEHADLWEEYWRVGSVETRNALVEALLPQAIGFARKAVAHRAERPFGFKLTDDEKAAVAIGLVKVVERYDPSLASLGTYMWWVVHGVVVELWRRQGWFPRRWFSRESHDLRGRSISMLSLDKIREDHERAGSAQHTDGWVPDALVNQDGMRETEDAVSARDECLLYLSVLSGRDRLVIRRRYVEDASFRVIAEDLGVTRQRVSFIHKRALKKLREFIEKNVNVRIESNEKDKGSICT